MWIVSVGSGGLDNAVEMALDFAPSFESLSRKFLRGIAMFFPICSARILYIARDTNASSRCPDVASNAGLVIVITLVAKVPVVNFEVPHFNSLPPVVVSLRPQFYKPTKMNNRSQEIINAGG